MNRLNRQYDKTLLIMVLLTFALVIYVTFYDGNPLLVFVPAGIFLLVAIIALLIGIFKEYFYND